MYIYMCNNFINCLNNLVRCKFNNVNSKHYIVVLYTVFQYELWINEWHDFNYFLIDKFIKVHTLADCMSRDKPRNEDGSHN